MSWCDKPHTVRPCPAYFPPPSAGVRLAAAAVIAAPAQAANLTPVTGFGSNPGNLSMYSYRPDGLPAGRPLVVLLHGCTQDATGYFTNSGWRKFADQWGFQLLLAAAKQLQPREQMLHLVRERRHQPRSGRGALDPQHGRLRGVEPRRRRQPRLRQRTVRGRGDERGHARHLSRSVQSRIDRGRDRLQVRDIARADHQLPIQPESTRPRSSGAIWCERRAPGPTRGWPSGTEPPTAPSCHATRPS